MHTLPAHQMQPWSPPCPRFYKTETGVRVQELRVGSGAVVRLQDTVEVEYVLRRSNGYFIYSTVEGISFQPSDVPIGPVDLRLVCTHPPA